MKILKLWFKVLFWSAIVTGVLGGLGYVASLSRALSVVVLGGLALLGVTLITVVIAQGQR